MSVSIAQEKSWEQRMKNGKSLLPGGMDLRIGDSSSIKARLVAISEQAKNVIEYMRDHPIDFLLSTAVSMATFIALKTVITASLPLVGISIGAIGAAMLTSGLLAMGRTTHQEFLARGERVEALNDRAAKAGEPPSAEDLADARSINTTAILNRALRQSLFTGILSGVLGSGVMYIYENLPTINFDFDIAAPAYLGDFPMTNGEYARFFDGIAAIESQNSGGYQADSTTSTALGRYQLLEGTLEDIGYYTDNSSSTEWTGTWRSDLGIESKADFLNSPDVQEHAMQDHMRKQWNYIRHYGLDSHIGETIHGAVITESSLLAGAHKEGIGGLRKFIEEGINPKEGTRHLSDYMSEMSNYKVPFQAGTDGQLPFEMTHCWPIDPSDQQRISSQYGQRWGRMHHGLDIAAPYGTQIHPTEAGQILSAGTVSGYGNQVIIQHAGGWKTSYNHLSSINVAPNQMVDPQDIIGGVGSTGHSTGNHLHLEIRRPDGSSVNPLPRLTKECWDASLTR